MLTCLGTLYKEGSEYKLSELKNALKDSDLESPIDPFGGADNFDISAHGLVFTAKDPELNPATHTKTNIYLSASENFWLDLVKGLPSFFKVPIYNFAGASTSPVWDQIGKQIAFLSMRQDGYESDKNQVFVITDWRNPGWVVHLWANDDYTGLWDRSPQSISWGSKGQLFLTAEDHGRLDLFVGTTLPEADTPTKLVEGGSIGDVRPLRNGAIFLSSTSLIENSLYSIIPTAYKEETVHGNKSYTLPIDDRPREIDVHPPSVINEYKASDLTSTLR